jgi:hypothetical protein
MVESSTDGPSPAVRLNTSRSHGSKVGMQGGHGLERRQVVGMGGAVGLAARRVEHVHGLAEAYFDTDGLEGGERRPPAAAHHGVEVAGVDTELRDVAAREPARQPPDVGDRGGRPAGEHVDHLGRDAPRGSTDRLDDVLTRDVLGVGTDP